MDLRFWPTLKLMAFARAARGILYTFDLEELKNRYTMLGRVRGDYIKEMEEKVSEIVIQAFGYTFARLSVSPRKAEGVKHLPLPLSLQNQMVGIVMALGLEVKKWYNCHSFILHDSNLKLINRLSWFSFGIVDRFKTAQTFIQDETVSNVERFYLACKYYFESDVQLLWTNMSENERSYVAANLGYTESMKHWLRALESENALDWGHISSNLTPAFFNENYLGMRYYFTKIDSNNRYECFISAIRNQVHYFDLYACLHQLNTDELFSVLEELPQADKSTLLQFLLDWPLQIMFLEVTNVFKDYIDSVICYKLISCILFDKIEKGWQDHQYIPLLRHFWSRMPVESRRDVNADGCLSALLNYVLKSTMPFDLQDYRFFIDNNTTFVIL